MPDFVFAPAALPSLPVAGRAERFAVHRIFCVGRNYVAHAIEMGGEVDREAPFYFTKSAHALAQSGAALPYPPGTADLHHEVELVVALGPGEAGIDEAEALSHVYGYATGLDMTRRDLQAVAKSHRRPWDTGKDFEGSAVIGPITEGPLADDAEIRLVVNGQVRQEAPIADMVWSVPELIAHLSTLYTLRAGDIIMTGTPAGVAAVGPGDSLCGVVTGLEFVELTYV